MKSNQFLFNKAYRGLLKQGGKSITTAGGCRYRGPDDTRWGVGQVLPNSAYDTCMEGQSVRDLFENFPKAMQRAGIRKDSAALLSSIQIVHDNEDVAALAHVFALAIPRVAA